MSTMQPTPPVFADEGGRLKRGLAVIKAAVPMLSQHGVQILAAGVAFNIFIAIFPGLVAAVAIISLVTDDVTDLLARLEFLPPELTELIAPELASLADAGGGASVALLVGVGGSLFAASSAAGALMTALNQINDTTESRNVVVQRLVALLLVVALLGALVAMVVLVVLGPQLRRFLLPEQFLGGWSEVGLTVLQGVGAVAILMLLFSFILWRAPDRHDVEHHWVTPGSAFGVVGWLVLSGLFTIYTQTFGNYGATYGALAGVIVVLVWLQLSMTVLLFGACIDVVHQRRQEVAEVPPEPALAAADPAAAVSLPAVRGEVSGGGATDLPASITTTRTGDGPDVAQVSAGRSAATSTTATTPTAGAPTSRTATPRPAAPTAVGTAPAPPRRGPLVAVGAVAVTIAGVAAGIWRRRRS